MGTGRPLEVVREKVARLTARQMAGESRQGVLYLEALKRILERDEPGGSER
jgi:hypothetical protein